MSDFLSISHFSYPRLDLKYSRLHLRSYHHHPFNRSYRHRNLNRLEGYRPRKSLPSLYVDHQYQHRTDQDSVNYVPNETEKSQIHKKRKLYSHSNEFEIDEQYHQRQRRNINSEQRAKSKKRIRTVAAK